MLQAFVQKLVLSALTMAFIALCGVYNAAHAEDAKKFSSDAAKQHL